MDTELTIKNKVREVYKIEEQKSDDTKLTMLQKILQNHASQYEQRMIHSMYQSTLQEIHTLRPHSLEAFRKIPWVRQADVEIVGQEMIAVFHDVP